MHKKEGNFDLAIDAFRQALGLIKRIGDEKGEVKCLIRLGLLCWNSGQLEESSEKYRLAMSLAKQLNLKKIQEECQSALEIYRLYREGRKLSSLGHLQNATTSFQKAIDLARKSGYKEHELKCIIQLSFIHWELNKLKSFFFLNKKALSIAQRLNHRKEEGSCLYNIGLYYWKLDNYSKAINFYKESLIIARTYKNKEDESACLNNMGIIYYKVGNYNKAQEYLISALTLDKLLLKDDIYISMNNIGEIFRKEGLVSGDKEDFLKALDYFYDCFELARKSGNRKAEVFVLNNIGTVHIDLENYHKALEYLQLGYKKAIEIRHLEAIGMILDNIGIAHFYQGDYEEATKSFQKAIELADRISNRRILWEAYFWLGRCREMRNNFSLAVICYKRAIDIIDHIRSQILLDVYKVGFAKDKLIVYEFLINLLYRLKIEDPSNSYDKEIFHIVERAKARAFLESLGESKVEIREKLNYELKKRENEISNRISLIIQELSKPNLSKKKRKELLSKLQQEEDEYLWLISKMREEIPEIDNLVANMPCRVEQVQQLLEGNTALIEYFLGGDQSVVFFITKNEFDVYPLPSRSEIEKSISAYLKILSNSPKGKFKGILAANRIYQELFFIAKNIPDNIENLIIVPDGLLYYLPFETLIPYIQNQFWKSDYLIEDYKISYAPSSSILFFLSKEKPKYESPKGLLAFGNPSYDLKVSSKGEKYKTYIEILSELYLNQGFDFSPLPYSKREILKISKYFSNDKKDVYLKKEAKEEIVKKLPLADYQIIHFACHGFLDEETPFRSALVLSLDEDSNEDGFLQVREIYNLRLKADLIVLSACQTGKGKLEKGEGILGLPRVFFYIGAKSVVITLWRINDESTSIFMNSFYYYLSLGNDKAQALRLAKLKMLNSKFCHPFYWAAFILNGDSNSTLNFK